ncbi:hypothetical protein BGZ60DRAFT_529445 [Tricladium varicosporioides]|nr:hypothetical protein BGZ60DRAFT_529445 [Hymenoscyphus varicosporioides]
MVRLLAFRGSSSARCFKATKLWATTIRTTVSQTDKSDLKFNLDPSEAHDDDADFSSFSGDLEALLDLPAPSLSQISRDGVIRRSFSTPDLPVSPLMDTAFHNARNKNFKSKATPPTANDPRLSPFQRKLYKNPYAQALATPVRVCTLSKTALPKFFLQTFRIIGHPDNGEPYYVPTSRILQDTKRALKKSESQESTSKEVSTTDESALVRRIKPGEKVEGNRLRSSSYMLARKSLVGSMYDPNSGYGKHPFTYLIPPRARQNQQLSAIYYMSIYRKDMADFVMMIMRRRITEHLRYLMTERPFYVSGLNNLKDLRQPARTAAFFWTGCDHSPPPSEFSEINGKPFYNLRALLGEENVAALQEEIPRAGAAGSILVFKTISPFSKPLIALKHQPGTINLQLRLWWLQGYLAEHKKHLIANQ